MSAWGAGKNADVVLEYAPLVKTCARTFVQRETARAIASGDRYVDIAARNGITGRAFFRRVSRTKLAMRKALLPVGVCSA